MEFPFQIFLYCIAALNTAKPNIITGTIRNDLLQLLESLHACPCKYQLVLHTEKFLKLLQANSAGR